MCLQSRRNVVFGVARRVEAHNVELLAGVTRQDRLDKKRYCVVAQITRDIADPKFAVHDAQIGMRAPLFPQDPFVAFTPEAMLLK